MNSYRIVEKHPAMPPSERWWVIEEGADPDTSPRFADLEAARASIAQIPDELVTVVRF